MRKRWLKIIAWVVLGPPLLLLAFLLVEHVRGRWALQQYRRVLLAQGVKLSPQDFAAPAPTAENGAPEIAAAYKELPKGIALPDHCPPAMVLTPAGHAIIGFREEQWSDGEATNRWAEVDRDLEPNEPTLARVSAALEKPVLDNQLDYSVGSRMHLKQLGVPRTLVRWFGSRGQLALYEGRPQEALPDLLACVQMPRFLARDHLAISELVRIAVAAMARTYTWEALQTNGWTDSDLARLQHAWQELEFATPMVQALEGEMVFSEASYPSMRQSNADTVAVLFGLEDYLPLPAWEVSLRNLPGGGPVMEFCKKQLYCRLWRFAWLDQNECHDLEQLQSLLLIARTGASSKSAAALQPLMERWGEGVANRSLYDHLRYPTDSSSSLSRVMSRAMHAETERALCLCAIALKRYALAHTQVPPSLEALVPEFLPSVPLDYMDGRPLRYHRNPDGTFTLYSVGEDGRDDGGDAAPLKEKALPNLWGEKDVVWPAPASQEEVEAYRKGKLKP